MTSLSFLTLGYMQKGLAASLLVGTACSMAGVFIILRQIVFVSMVLAQLAVLGFSAAIFFEFPYIFKFLTAFAMTLAGVLYMALFQLKNKTPADATLGMGFIFCHAASLLLLAKSTAGLEEIRHLTSGNLLSVTGEEITALCAAWVFMAVIHFTGHRSFVFVCADDEFARISGVKVTLWEVLFYISLGLIISVSLQAVGVFYVFSCLVFPAMTGLLAARKISSIQIVSFIAAVIASFAGICFSYIYDFPTSESIIAWQIITYAAAAALAKAKRILLRYRPLRYYYKIMRRRISTFYNQKFGPRKKRDA
ncbi:MAG: hypothetical protein A2008_03615 [Candidatus Wallbacteria bacterium GWC2_49_35]|uniref:ABC transporter n=1 Tax=Candidatus Wallbacteria bacterium GWC2_49_35 TaxID=1817813 RepID=A0A1F7X141_9BACT|nr:MAG: hypothetical protein A2008_03615 [Candidatus Wallbacteria bacterium GWC2_49_35]HBC74284.1 hypothetical protein [Candidatus Wallbacteria bacterium]